VDLVMMFGILGLVGEAEANKEHAILKNAFGPKHGQRKGPYPLLWPPDRRWILLPRTHLRAEGLSAWATTWGHFLCDRAKELH
jgi:hypothetical protein